MLLYLTLKCFNLNSYTTVLASTTLFQDIWTMDTHYGMRIWRGQDLQNHVTCNLLIVKSVPHLRAYRTGVKTENACTEKIIQTNDTFINIIWYHTLDQFHPSLLGTLVRLQLDLVTLLPLVVTREPRQRPELPWWSATPALWTPARARAPDFRHVGA